MLVTRRGSSAEASGEDNRNTTRPGAVTDRRNALTANLRRHGGEPNRRATAGQEQRDE